MEMPSHPDLAQAKSPTDRAAWNSETGVHALQALLEPTDGSKIDEVIEILRLILASQVRIEAKIGSSPPAAH